MEPRKFLTLSKALRRPRSETGIGPIQDPMEVDPGVSLRPTESTPDLGIGPTASGLSAPNNQGTSGMQPNCLLIIYLTTLFV